MIANEYNKTKKRLKFYGDVYQLRYWEMPELGLADLLVREHKIPKAITAYDKIIRDSKEESKESVQALNNVIILLDGSLNDTKGYANSDRIKKKMSIYADKLFKNSDDADIFYWLGKSFLLRGEKREALNYFKKAESKFSADNKFKDISRKFVARLENE
jgi:tetratricopeptide (TPR) repeat protein